MISFLTNQLAVLARAVTLLWLLVNFKPYVFETKRNASFAVLRGVYTIKTKLHGRLEIRNFSLVEKYLFFQHEMSSFVSPRVQVISSLSSG